MNNKIFWLILGVVVFAVVLWWWTSRFDMVSAPTPTPAAQIDPDIKELNSIDANQNLDAEFKVIDRDLDNL